MNDLNTFFLLSFALGFTFGFVTQRKQFCFNGGIKDIILFKHTKRSASLLVAITTAIIFTQFFSFFTNTNLMETRYYENINYFFILLGGSLFGYGMMISDGCSSRHLIKVSQGEKESFFILLAMGISALFTYKFLGAFHTIIYSSEFVQFFEHKSAYKIPLLFILFVLVYAICKTIKKSTNIFQTWDGFLIGIIITLGWVITYYTYNYLLIDISLQSLSFVFPIGKIVEYFSLGFNSNILFLFPVIVVIGVILGAFISFKTNKQYSKKQMCDNSMMNPPSLIKKLFGGVCMGIGGILAIGCTVGQGLSGLSTLSFASFFAIAVIYLSAYITGIYLNKQNGLIACFIFDFDNKKID